MGRRLTDEQIAQYRRDGYVSPVRIMSEEEAAGLRRKLEAFESAQGRPLHGTQKTKSFLLFPWLWELMHHAALLDAVEDLIGPDILVYQNAAWIKERETGSYVSWHQDISYFGMDPPELVTAWIALTPATIGSGCMRVVPGSHRLGQLPVDYTELEPTNLLASGQRVRHPIDEAETVAMALRPGEISLHHVCLIHASFPNHAEDRRVGFTACCLAPSVRQTTTIKAPATLVRGADRFGHYPAIERRPVAPDDPATIAMHARAVELYRSKSVECGNRTAWRLG